jgi:alkaline phosphatase D
MTTLNRRQFLQLATAIGATAAWTSAAAFPSPLAPAEHLDLYPEGVASADPYHDSVLLWTRHAPLDAPATLIAEISEDATFTKVIATTTTKISPADAEGFASRTGRTITAPAPDDPRPTNFAFISCQNANDGAQNAYRRMIFEDEKAPAPEKLGFVLHLGDFIYELVWYPEDRPQGMYDRKIRDIVRYAHGEKIDDFHIPTTLDDYRSVYKAYLHDPDLQDARARWPFVNMWDNHEFSWKGWQGLQNFDGKNRPAQTRKVAALQAFFEYQPARMAQPNTGNQTPDQFHPPKVSDAPITKFDNHGLGEEPNNLVAIHSLKGYRTLRYGRHIDVIITDQRSYRSEEPTDRPEAEPFNSKDFPELFPQEAQEILDAGRAYNNGNPPQTIRFGEKEIPNFAKFERPRTMLGAVD